MHWKSILILIYEILLNEKGTNFFNRDRICVACNKPHPSFINVTSHCMGNRLYFNENSHILRHLGDGKFIGYDPETFHDGKRFFQLIIGRFSITQCTMYRPMNILLSFIVVYAYILCTWYKLLKQIIFRLKGMSIIMQCTRWNSMSIEAIEQIIAWK